jgi:thymidine phosphorylase|tara:strand:- start:37233 stop:37502 length:270 start_codon:yes stop_codon:yes gene_type:complete
MYAVIFHMLIPQEIIAMKRVYRAVSRAQMKLLVTGMVHGVVSGGFRDYQVSALVVGAVVHLSAVGRRAITYSAQPVACSNVIIDQISES